MSALLARDAMPWRERGKVDRHALAFAEAWAVETPLRIQVRRAADIEGALLLMRRHERSGYLVGLAEGDRLRDALLKADVPIVLRIEQP